ncbi:MAG: hypothetical protein JW808_02985 [Victivallales bacterium]|nr:hypothetical protein [Victivallales bacterium]
MIYNIVIGLVMVACFVGMIICAKKQHTNSLAKPLAIVLLLVVVACTVLILVKNLGSGDTKKLIENEMKFAKASTYVLGKKIAEVKPGANVLIIVEDDMAVNPRQATLIDGFKEGFGSSITNITIKSPQVQKPKGAPEEFAMPMMELMTTEHFNKLLDQNRSCNLVITMIGLPYDMAKLNIWQQFERDPKKTPNLCLMNTEISMMYPAIKGGLVLAAVTYNPDARYTEDPAPTDPQQAFDMRYLLITTENVDEIAEKFGERLFQKPK